MSAIPGTLFITGTDTDAGKTHVACALLRGLRQQGYAPQPFKPVASGCAPSPVGLRSSDALSLIAASGSTAPYAHINPYAFAPAIAPHIAAAQAGVTVASSTLLAAHHALASYGNGVLVEGAGGWHTPLYGRHTLGEWVAEQGWPVLLVVGIKLGGLNHAQLSALAIQQNSPWLGWVANVLPPVLPEASQNIDWLSQKLGPPLWVQQGASPPSVAVIAALAKKMSWPKASP